MKKLFNAFIKRLELLPVKIIYLKTYVFEWIDVYRKRELYKNVKWSNEQKREFDDYWIKNYGKKISPRWHKLYESINGKFDVTYLPDVIYSTVIAPKIIPYYVGKALCDKSLIEIIAKAAGVEVPTTYLLNSYGFYYDKNRNIVLKKDAALLLKNIDDAVIKPTVDGNSGKGIKTTSFNEGSLAEIEKKLDLSVEVNHIVQKKINQHETFARLHPMSINTLRVITYIGENGISHWPLSMRIGTGKSNVDNIHAGGLVVGVDDEGNLSETAYFLGHCDSKRNCKVHPDTGIVFKNYKISNVYDVIRSAEKLHGFFPGIGMISWDFTVSSSGSPIVIEANIMGQSVWFPQIVNKKGMSEEMLHFVRK